MTKPVHVCILTTAHPFDDVRVRNKFWRAFQDRGYDVTWVGPDHAFFDSRLNGERDRFRLFPRAEGRAGRLLAFRKAADVARTVTDVDVYYAPEPDAAAVAVKLARNSSAKVVFDIHEVYHGPMLDRWLGGLQLGPVREMFRRRIARLCGRCDLTIGVSKAVLESYGELKCRCVVVRSCSPAFFGEGPPADVCGQDRESFTVMHGKSELGRGTLSVMEALAIARKKTPTYRAIMFEEFFDPGGAARRQFDARNDELGLGDAVDLRPGVPMTEMPKILRECDAGLISYNRRLGADSLPNRLFEYMAAGLPIVAPVYADEIAAVVKGEGCGLLADFENPQSVADALVHLRSNPDECRAMGERSRKAFSEKHNWDTEVRPLFEWIEQ